MSEPLAERMRPKTLDEYVGQQHLVGPGAVLRKMAERSEERRVGKECRSRWSPYH